MGFDMANSQQRIMVATQRCRKPGAGLLAWQPLVDVEVPIPKAAVVRVVTLVFHSCAHVREVAAGLMSLVRLEPGCGSVACWFGPRRILIWDR